MMTAVSIFSCTNDYDPGLIENLGMKEQPLRIITKVLTTKEGTEKGILLRFNPNL